jgi:hypothetical protein
LRVLESVGVTRSLWIKLALPLALVAGGCLWLNTIQSMDGFFLNLATELLGIIVTIAYVDWVLRAHEREVWRGTSARIRNRLGVLSNATVTGLRSSLGFGADYLDQRALRTNDMKQISAEVMRVGIHVLLPALRWRLEMLDAKGWKSLANRLQEIWQQAERLLDQFGHRLAPTDIELLLDLQQEIDSSLTFWRTFPDIAGVPDSDLPPTKTDTVALKAAWNDLTAEALARILRLAKSISERSNA